VDIGAWLRSLGLDHYERAFRDNDIDAQVLPDLTADDLTGLGVVSIGHRRKLLAAIAALRADPAVPQITPGLAGLAPDPPLAAAIRHAEAERRQLTVMFVDLVGSTALSTRLDPEEMREVLRAYQVAVAHEVMRFEGHIAKYMGDGVLAYFGWPRAHEDEVERAARAALAIIEAVSQLKALDDEPLACRIGIATGLVVVGDLVGEGPAQEEAVLGETPNLAARLQQVAQPGTVMIAQATRHLLEGLFDFEELDALALKGLPGSTRAYWLIGAAAAESRFEARHARRGIPLVGREQELALLLKRWEQAKSGEGQVVLLLGEPGIGKSRIALALREQSARERRISLRYYGSSYHSDTALRPVIEQLERAAGFARDDTPTAKLDKLEALLAKADDPKVAAPVLAGLLGLPTDVRYPPLDMTPPVLRARTLELLLAQCLGLARQQPVLVILEDAHWLDPTTRELFDRLVERVHSSPVLLLVTTRREFVPPWTGYAHVTLMSLNRLSTRQAETVVERVVAASRCRARCWVKSLRRLIASRCSWKS
jgi:class 3 adenylate cyclase/(2Fe-2S) ferredoxin